MRQATGQWSDGTCNLAFGELGPDLARKVGKLYNVRRYKLGNWVYMGLAFAQAVINFSNLVSATEK